MDQLALPGQVREASPRRWKRDKHFKKQEQNVKNFRVWNGLTSSRSISVWEACCSSVRGTVRDGWETRAVYHGVGSALPALPLVINKLLSCSVPQSSPL